MRRFRAPVVAHALLGAVALLLAVAALAAEPVFPTLTGRIVDDAGILAPDARSRLDARLAEQERATGQQIVVVTLKSLQGYPIEDFGYRLGRRWGIGQKGRDNGALLIVAPNERKVRIEVGELGGERAARAVVEDAGLVDHAACELRKRLRGRRQGEQEHRETREQRAAHGWQRAHHQLPEAPPPPKSPPPPEKPPSDDDDP